MAGPSAPFSVPLHVSAHSGRMWIGPESQPRDYDEELVLKGANWDGLETSHGCPEDSKYGASPHHVERFIDFLSSHGYNAVRLPLNAVALVANHVAWYTCGGYAGRLVWDVLDDMIGKLSRAGLFVVLDIHQITFPPRENEGLWCAEPSTAHGSEGCAVGDEVREDEPWGRGSRAGSSEVWQPWSEQILSVAWKKLARRYCGTQNVIIADLFNEPHEGHWADPQQPPGRDWAALATRLGNTVLRICPRWLIAVEGVGRGSGTECQDASGSSCWWGENVLGQLTSPIMLDVPHRLVLSPHTYGHGEQSYMSHPEFPSNMPAVWDALWGRLAGRTGVPVLLGEWGGLWPATAPWQATLHGYLRQRGISHFYWQLPDTSIKEAADSSSATWMESEEGHTEAEMAPSPTARDFGDGCGS